MKRIGIISGTFNPIHKGHIVLAQSGLDQLNLDEVLILIDANPPGKPDAVSFQHRLCMVDLAVRDIPGIEATKLSLQQRAQNHTIATIRELQQAYSDAEIILLMGSDTFATLEHWSDKEDLFQLLSFGVAGRKGSKEANVPPRVRSLQIDMPHIPISSSDIRKAVARGGKPYGLPSSVLEYIKHTQLYLDTSGSHQP